MTLALLFGNHELSHLLASYGLGMVFLIVCAESVGVPLPGETTLTLAAIYAGATHQLSIVGVIAAAAGGAILGDNVGYGIGRWGGYRLLRRYGRYIRVDEHRLKIGRYLADRHGGKVVFFGRFVSILRTYAAFLAGTTQMRWRRFLAFNATGGIVWAVIYGVAFYYFGSGLNAPVHRRHRHRHRRAERLHHRPRLPPAQRGAARRGGRASVSRLGRDRARRPTPRARGGAGGSTRHRSVAAA
jgi:membrane protein DedA with SNARE-associated domain